MKWKEWLVHIFFKWLLIPLLIFFVAWFYNWLPWVDQDNPVEESIEKIIFIKTGVDVDLSPDSKENDGH